MKPQFLKVSTGSEQSFSARRDILPDINNRWHYHPEIELIYFNHGSGTQFIGDSISPFNDGDVILVGSNLPHYWQFDQQYFDTKHTPHVSSSVIHFSDHFWGETFLNLSENKEIKMTLDEAGRGIHITGQAGIQIGRLIEEIIYAKGARKLILLMQVLLAINECPKSKQLASIGFEHNFEQSEKDRINAIYNYSINNFKKKISLEEIAAVANISPNSFCKYFKSRSRKTYSRFINELRIGQACKLLIDGKLNVKEICYESGFYNFASFHKYFKQVTAKSPLNYQRAFTRAGFDS